MRKWFKEKFNIPFGRAILHFVISQVVLQIIWNWASKMVTTHTWIKEMGILVTFVFGMTLVAWYLPKISPRLSGASLEEKETRSGEGVRYKAELYTSRNELAKERGTLSDELSGYERVWAVFHTGTIITLLGVLAKCHFERLILTDPRDNYMMQRLEPRGKQSQNILMYKNQIKQVAEMVSKMGTDVRYYAGPIGDSLIIVDKIRLTDDRFSEQAWAKIETAIPFLAPDDRFSIVVKNKDNANAFNALLAHFNILWARSAPTPTEDLSYGRST